MTRIKPVYIVIVAVAALIINTMLILTPHVTYGQLWAPITSLAGYSETTDTDTTVGALEYKISKLEEYIRILKENCNQ